MLRIYLDCCSLQRPFDDQTQPRIKVESEAILAILAIVESGEVALLNSDALEYEISRIPNTIRRVESQSLLKLANEFIAMSSTVSVQANSFHARGIRPMDAIHLAMADVAKVDFFCTTDDRFLKLAQGIPQLSCRVVSVLDLLLEVSK
jgi:predicted nucleic acid-binding protein